MARRRLADLAYILVAVAVLVATFAALVNGL